MGLGFIAIIYLATYTERIPYVLLIYMEAIHVNHCVTDYEIVI